MAVGLFVKNYEDLLEGYDGPLPGVGKLNFDGKGLDKELVDTDETKDH